MPQLQALFSQIWNLEFHLEFFSNNEQIMFDFAQKMYTCRHKSVACIESPNVTPVFSLCAEGPCLIHSMNGDLLRTLEAPEKCMGPRLIQSSTEGHCMIYYDKGQFCLFSVNGKLLRHMEVHDNIKVRICLFLLQFIQESMLTFVCLHYIRADSLAD